MEILKVAIRWATRHFLSFVMIVVILVCANIFGEDIRMFVTASTELATLRLGRQDLEEHLRATEREVSKRISNLEKASDEVLKARGVALEKEIEEKKVRRKSAGGVASLLREQSIGKAYIDKFKLDLEISALEHERDFVVGTRQRSKALLNREAANLELERLRLVHVSTYAKQEKVKNARDEAKREYGIKRKLPWTDEHERYRGLEKDYAFQLAENDRAHEGYQRQLEILRSFRVPDLPKFEFDRKRVEEVLKPLYEKISEREEAIGDSWVGKVSGPAIEVLPTAFLILVSIILVPTGIKFFFYFVVAPWAKGRPAIRLLPTNPGSVSSSTSDGASENSREKMSAVALPVVLRENQELLVHPEYLQSTSVRATKRTQWLLNAGFPFASLLSGMYMLTRVSPAGSDPVVISATKDPLIEVGIVDLGEGAAFVCQPRSLVGVIQDQRHPIHITRHWRLGSLQSWLTLQLRFLVFHGPGRLVMKGCRGIRIESAGRGRLINQAATLGFSANLEYANSRCETFVSYWTGEEELFNDLFTGEPGVYVYEEMPNLKRKGGIGGSLEGFADTVLKVFGV